METATGETPESNLLEQFGTWLDTFPALPHWVAWLGFMTAICLAILSVLWVLWGANWWASLSPAGAERRATSLAEKCIRMHALSRNRPEMAIRVLSAVIWLTLTAICFLLTAMVTLHFGAPSSGGQPLSASLVTAQKAIEIVLFVLSFFSMLTLFVVAGRIEPLGNIVKYTRKMRARIEKILIKASVPEQIAAKHLRDFDDQVDEARKQEIR